MKKWDYTLNIKNFFMNYEGSFPLPSEETAKISKNIIHSIKNLQQIIGKDDELFHELDTVVEEFEVIGPEDDAQDAEDQFNYALDMLYDVGDYNKRIWIG